MTCDTTLYAASRNLTILTALPASFRINLEVTKELTKFDETRKLSLYSNSNNIILGQHPHCCVCVTATQYSCLIEEAGKSKTKINLVFVMAQHQTIGSFEMSLKFRYKETY